MKRNLAYGIMAIIASWVAWEFLTPVLGGLVAAVLAVVLGVAALMLIDASWRR